MKENTFTLIMLICAMLLGIMAATKYPEAAWGVVMVAFFGCISQFLIITKEPTRGQ